MRSTLDLTICLITRLAASRSAFEVVNALSVTLRCLMARLAASHSAFEVINTTFDITFICFLEFTLEKSDQNSVHFEIFELYETVGA